MADKVEMPQRYFPADLAYFASRSVEAVEVRQVVEACNRSGDVVEVFIPIIGGKSLNMTFRLSELVRAATAT